MSQVSTTRSCRPRILTGLALSLTLALGADAHATSFVGTSTVHTSTGGATSRPDVNVINGNSSAGNQFFNVTSSNDPLSSGSARVVSSNLLASYSFRTGEVGGAVYNVQPIVAVFALEGTVAAGSDSFFQATAGRVGFFSIAGDLVSNNYNQFNPVTWGAVNATGTVLATPIAVWDITLAEQVIDFGPDASPGGGPGVFNLALSQVNQVSVNATVGTSNQGFFLLGESQTFGGATLSGNSFLTVTGTGLPPAGFSLVGEGIVSRIDESYRLGTATNTNPIGGGPGTAGFDALNTIAALLGGLSDLDATIAGDQAFANAFGGLGNSGGDGRSFNPSNGNPNANTADVLFTLGTTSSPIVQAVPEPASITLLLGGLALCGIRGRRQTH